MKDPLSKAAALLLTLTSLALPADGQIVIPEDRTLLNAYHAGAPDDPQGQINFLTDPDNNGSFDSTPQQAGFRYQSITGFGIVYDTCADFFSGETDPLTYSVTPGLGMYDSGRQAQIRALFSNAMPGFESLLSAYIVLNDGDWAYNPAFANQFSDLQGFAGGMQVALWEIIHEQVSTLGVEVSGPGVFEATANPAFQDSRANRALGYANMFLENINGPVPAWTDEGGYNYFFAEGGSNQDRLWIAPVPEPSSGLLATLGSLALLRRRRA